jgi:signal transduction histidine kinase
MRSRAAAKKIALRVDVNPEARSIDADPTALRQVLTNLVDNAVRHTATGEVVVQARASNGGISVRVRDTGAGIRPEHLARIFERFIASTPCTLAR